MGLLQRAKDAFSSEGGGESDEIGDFSDEFEGDGDGPMGEPEVDDVEPEPEPEWDTAYQFADDVVETMGFSGMQEFMVKSMAYRVSRSKMYRDRFESGIQTMDRVTQSMSTLGELQGELGRDMDENEYKQYAETIRDANNLMDELDRMEGKEEQMAAEIMDIARSAIEGFNENQMKASDVSSSIGVVEDQ